MIHMKKEEKPLMMGQMILFQNLFQKKLFGIPLFQHRHRDGEKNLHFYSSILKVTIKRLPFPGLALNTDLAPVAHNYILSNL